MDGVNIRKQNGDARLHGDDGQGCVMMKCVKLMDVIPTPSPPPSVAGSDLSVGEERKKSKKKKKKSKSSKSGKDQGATGSGQAAAVPNSNTSATSVEPPSTGGALHRPDPS